MFRRAGVANRQPEDARGVLMTRPLVDLFAMVLHLRGVLGVDGAEELLRLAREADEVIAVGRLGTASMAACAPEQRATRERATHHRARARER